MTKENIRGKTKSYRRERIMSSAQVGGCGMSTSFILRFIIDLFRPNVGNWNSSFCPQIIDMKVYLVWHPWDGVLHTKTSDTGDIRRTEEWDLNRSVLHWIPTLSLLFTSFMALILNLFQSWKKIVKTNINKSHCFLTFNVKDILILRMIQFKRRSKIGLLNSD